MTYLRLKLCQLGVEEVTESIEKRKPNWNRIETAFFCKIPTETEPKTVTTLTQYH